jgi:toxin ParE1/3/4
MPGVLKRPQALADVAEIWAYIADDSPANAEAFAALIDTKLQALGRQPGMGRNRDELHQYLRSFPVDRNVIFYLALSDGIEVVRVLHGARAIEAVFHHDE